MSTPNADAEWKTLAPGIWCLTHHFRNLGMPISTRMSVVRLSDGSLMALSAVPLTPDQNRQLSSWGTLRHIIAPNAMHHLFLGDVHALHPQAQLYGPPSLIKKRPDLPLQPWPGQDTPWFPEMQHLRFEGIPMLDEASWFHHKSATLFMADVCQLWQGPLSLPVRTYLRLTGGHERLAVPRTVRLLTRNASAARASADALLRLPVRRLVLLHNSVLETNVKSRLSEAFSIWPKNTG